ncbi:MAG: iron-containing alcohol dehydrogenase [Spirochaetaceae bacterium]|nr:iron-containing alcohol dehydrogenase [Spirochaetaceae bacterium]
MNNNSIRVQPGAVNYYCHSGAINKIEEFFCKDELNASIYIHGEKSGESIQQYLSKEVRDSKNNYLVSGHCTHEIVDLIVGESSNPPVIIGAGGGTVLDIAKAVAAKLNKPFISIPTIAATCAAWTPLSVWYTKEGNAINYEIFNSAAFLVVVEPQVILEAPSIYLRAGIGDTIAKYYEADILTKKEKDIPLTASIGLVISKQIGDVLFKEGASAFRAMDIKKLSPSFIRVVDAIIAGGGLVGGLGERYTRIAAAHAIHNGLSQLESSKKVLHGIKVSYGILVQTALLKDKEELEKLYNKFLILELPTKLSDIGVDFNNRNDVNKVINTAIAPNETISLLPFAVDNELLYRAIETVEKLSK